MFSVALLYTALLLGSAYAAAIEELAAKVNCPSYADYSFSPQGHNNSAGPLHLPFMRPPKGCRTFNSTAVEKVVADVTSRMKDKDLARLFENTFPNTLDTTIKWFNKDLTFVVTGDIPAEWLRDSTNQFLVYAPLLGKDKKLANLTRGVINLQARYITDYPYCNAFQPPPESGLQPQCCSGDTGASISPPDDMSIVWTCGYELDSLLSFLQLSRTYYQFTQDKSIFTFNKGGWFNAVEAVLRVVDQQSVPTFTADGDIVSFYNISGPNQQYMKNRGRGPPKANTGMIGTTYRPSDDVVIFPFNIPHQAMAVVELRELASLLKQINMRPDLANRASDRVALVDAGIKKQAIVNTLQWGEVYAYEVDGYGGIVIQDDANVPSLLSLPYLGYLDVNDKVYQNTRKMLLSPAGNPYFGFGPVIRGIGGQHVDESHVWPMSLISQVATGTDDSEILTSLAYLKNTTSGLGLIHESVNTHDINDWTRQWFAWANSYFAQVILQLAEKKPQLLFTDGRPYRLADLVV